MRQLQSTFQNNYFHINMLATQSHPLILNLVSSTINAFRAPFLLCTSPLLWNYLVPYWNPIFCYCIDFVCFLTVVIVCCMYILYV